MNVIQSEVEYLLLLIIIIIINEEVTVNKYIFCSCLDRNDHICEQRWRMENPSPSRSEMLKGRQ